MRTRIFGAVAGALALATLACTDGFFFPSASDEPSTMALEWALAQSGPGEAFDQADNVRVRLFAPASSSPFFDEVVPFTPGPGQSRVTVSVPLEDAEGSLDLQVDVRVGSNALFRGAGDVTLTPGETRSVSVELEPVGSDVALPTPYPTLTAFGDVLLLGGAALFATGDTIPDVVPEFSNMDPGVVMVSRRTDGRWIATALSDGTARLTASWGDLSQQATVEVAAEVVSVDIEPAEVTISEDATVQLTAIPRDRNENQIPGRTADWTSLSPTIASVDGSGVARGEAPGNAIIEAEVGGVVGTAEVTVVPGLPIVTTLPPTAVSSRTAVLRGVVNPRGLATTARFEFGTDPALIQAASTTAQGVGSGQQDVQINAPISNLLPGTTYYARVVASVAGGTARGTILSFVTEDAPNPPSNLTLTIDGGVYVGWTDNSASEETFEVERAVQITASPGSASSQEDGDFQRIGTVPANSREFYDANPPAGRLTYRVRACATEGCSDYTPPASIDYVSPPAASTATATDVTTQTAVLNGAVDPRGSSTSAWFEYDDNPGLTSPLATPKTNVGAGSGAQSFSRFVDGLSPGITYYFRIRASNPGGETVGTIQAFTTLVPPTAPSGVVLGLGESIGVDISWSDNSNNETYFEIQREYVGPGSPGQGGAAAAVYLTIGTVPANTTFFKDASPPSPAVLNYRVRACHASGCSSYSLHAAIFYDF